MMKKVKRLNKIILVGLSFLSTVSLLSFTGCGVADNKSRDMGQQEISKEDMSIPAWQRYSDTPVTLDWYINYSWFVTGWGENIVSKKITEETGVSINFITPMGNEEEKLNTLITSNSLPDLITIGWWEPQVNNMISNDMVYSLKELADEYDIYFYDVANKTVIDWYTSPDGELYCYPCSSCVPQDLEKGNIGSNQTFLVRKDIYEAIGSPDMTTTEGFSEAVRRAKEEFPTVDGKELIPIGAHSFDDMGCTSFDKYLMNFLAVPYEKDGEYYDRYTDPEYIRWLKAFRDLGEEGYLDNGIFMDTRTQMSEKIEEGRYFCMLYQRTDLADQQKILYSKSPESIYIAVDGPKNSRGDDYVLPTNSTNGWTVTLISKNCKYPERAIGLMDYLISEHGQKLTSIGIEGVTYDIVDGEYVLKEEVKNILNRDRGEYDRLYGADNAYWMLQDNIMQLEWMPPKDEPLRQMEEWTYPYTKYTGQYDLYIKENSAVGVAYAKINRLWSETLKRLLISESEEEFDGILEEFAEKRNALGYDIVVREATRQMQENKRRLGIK